MTALFIWRFAGLWVINLMATDRDISKYMSHVLRHAPESAGLQLDAGGWCDVEALIAAAPMPLDRTRLAQVIEGSDKQRFALSPDGSRVRTNQGHSIPVDLGLVPVAPPAQLYHGTARANLASIRAEGLKCGSRHHVHLSPDPETARNVGMRHGAPFVLTVESGAMALDGHDFFRSENGVWLTDHVPPRYLAPDD